MTVFEVTRLGQDTFLAFIIPEQGCQPRTINGTFDEVKTIIPEQAQSYIAKAFAGECSLDLLQIVLPGHNFIFD
ncbi:MAG: hypothetical protein ABH884_00085 [Candidatus Komeilibacteria bacterium]